jgi:hypothetical protein
MAIQALSNTVHASQSVGIPATLTTHSNLPFNSARYEHYSIKNPGIPGLIRLNRELRLLMTQEWRRGDAAEILRVVC